MADDHHRDRTRTHSRSWCARWSIGRRSRGCATRWVPACASAWPSLTAGSRSRSAARASTRSPASSPDSGASSRCSNRQACASRLAARRRRARCALLRYCGVGELGHRCEPPRRRHLARWCRGRAGATLVVTAMDPHRRQARARRPAGDRGTGSRRRARSRSRATPRRSISSNSLSKWPSRGLYEPTSSAVTIASNVTPRRGLLAANEARSMLLRMISLKRRRQAAQRCCRVGKRRPILHRVAELARHRRRSRARRARRRRGASSRRG